MTARCISLNMRDQLQNLSDPACEGCSGTGMCQGHRCVCTRPLPRTTFATLAEATEACAGDPWRTPGWTGQAWVLGQMREHPCTCPKCGYKHFAWTDVCNERCNGPAFGGGA